MADRVKVLVGIPTMTNRVTVQITALLDAMREAASSADAPFTFDMTIKHGFAPVEYARNAIIGDFLRSRCDKLLFLDEDMLPDLSVLRMLQSPLDITCAQMYRFDHPHERNGMTAGLGLCAMVKQPNGLYSQLMTRPGMPCLVEVDAVGTACTVIDRRVVEDRRMWFDNVYTMPNGNVIDGNVMPAEGDFAPAVFRFLRGPNGLQIMGEDVDFCARAKALGYSVGVDLNARCGHWKTIDIDAAGSIATETVRRVVAGVNSNLGDGKVFKFAVQDKGLDGPAVDKMVHAGDFKAKAV